MRAFRTLSNDSTCSSPSFELPWCRAISSAHRLLALNTRCERFAAYHAGLYTPAPRDKLIGRPVASFIGTPCSAGRVSAFRVCFDPCHIKLSFVRSEEHTSELQSLMR